VTPQDSHKCARTLMRSAIVPAGTDDDPIRRDLHPDPDSGPRPARDRIRGPVPGLGHGSCRLLGARALWLGRCPARGVSVVLPTVRYVPPVGGGRETGPTRHRHSTTPCLSRAVLMGRGPYIAMPEAIRASWTATLSTPACGHASRIHADAMCRTQSRTCVHAEKTE
jgi:hypothetical protein